MSSSYNTSIPSSSSHQPFFIIGSGARDIDFNQNDTLMSMNQQTNSFPPPPKKRRNQPGNPNPDAEVVLLSPKSLMATNRFICDVCKKGFQREQNLQLHRRGHNLPWKLKQKSTKLVKKKVYLCPEPTCVHHDPSRALGDLTGVKKHYYRKHGEKKWKCEKCCKRYAVQSDWKAHCKTCGTKEYRCDCGTIFSRRDSYITHKAFCDALIQETTRNPSVRFTSMAAAASSGSYGRLGGSNVFSNHPNSGFTPRPGYNLNIGSSDNSRDFVSQSSNPNFLIQYLSSQGMLTAPHNNNDQSFMNQPGLNQLTDPVLDKINLENSNTNNSFFNLGFFQESNKNLEMSLPSLYSSNVRVNHCEENLNAGCNISATALLQKATQLGSITTTNPSTSFRGLSNSSSVVANDFDGSDKLTLLDFFGVGGMVRNVNGGRDHGEVSLDGEVKFVEQNHPFGKA